MVTQLAGRWNYHERGPFHASWKDQRRHFARSGSENSLLEPIFGPFSAAERLLGGFQAHHGRKVMA